MKKIFYFLLLFLLLPFVSEARTQDEIHDWYIKSFQVNFKIQEDSSLLVTENILADCGSLSGKHGIFRTLPYEIKTNQGKTIETPIDLVSITDFSGSKINYTTERSFSDKTITWKIGDADKTVKGENEYRITYKVKNAAWVLGENKDEFYWNLSGNFWQLEIDDFIAQIEFPKGIQKENVDLSYYAGKVGSQDSSDVSIEWKSDNILQVSYAKTMNPGEGVTLSAVFPSGILTPYEEPFIQKYAFILWLIWPIVTFLVVFKIWQKYGKDPKSKKTIIPEFEIPDKLSPGEILLIEKNGTFQNVIITASLINLAVKGVIKIEEIEKKGLFGGKDHKLIMQDEKKLEEMSGLEKLILEKIMKGKKEKSISELKNKFQAELREIKKYATNMVVDGGYIVKSGGTFKAVFLTLGAIMFFLSFSLIDFSPYLFLGLFFSALIIFIFAFLMPKRTEKGTEIAWKTKGFKLYMETAEKQRQEFYEKENIFEKFLPYAVAFGMTKLWIKKMKDIYGEEYFNNYHPIWYTGMLTDNFNVDSFVSSMENVSSAIASNVSSGSGSGGGGFSGGGGGGGGGGGW